MSVTMCQQEDWEAEFKFDLSLSPIQRRKAHIICAFQQLPHNSIGALGDRRVVAYMKVDPRRPPKPSASHHGTLCPSPQH